MDSSWLRYLLAEYMRRNFPKSEIVETEDTEEYDVTVVTNLGKKFRIRITEE